MNARRDATSRCRNAALRGRSAPVVCVKLPVFLRVARSTSRVRSSWASSMSRRTPFPTAAATLDRDRALAHARQMRDDGADLVDIGGESSRPGALPVPEDEELARVLPLVDALAARRLRDRRRHAQARGDARGDRGRGGDDQRHRRAAARPVRSKRCAGTRRRRVPDAHAGRAADDAGGAGTTATSSRGPRLSRRARGRVPRGAASRASASRSIRALASARRWRIISRCCARCATFVATGLPRGRRACRASRRSASSPAGASMSGCRRASRRRSARSRAVPPSCACTTCARRSTR